MITRAEIEKLGALHVALPVPDVIEEMVSRVLEDSGDVTVITDGSSPVAARLF